MIVSGLQRHLNLSIIFVLCLLYCDICYSLGKLSDEIKAEENTSRAKAVSTKTTKDAKASHKAQKPTKYVNHKKSDRILIEKNGKFVANKFNPYVANLYKATDDEAQKLDSSDKIGTDLALKQLAAEFEKQILTLLLNKMFEASGVKNSQEFGSEIWNSELMSSIIETGYREGQIYEDVLEELRENERQQGTKILDDPNERKQISSDFSEKPHLVDEKDKKALAKRKHVFR